MLSRRLSVANSGKINHALIVAESKKTGAVAGFVEVGFLPSPPQYPAEKEMWMGVEFEKQKEVPYLANLAVDKFYKRQGLGAALVKVGAEMVFKSWNEKEVFVAVSNSNTPAINLYQNMGFNLFKGVDKSCYVLDDKSANLDGYEPESEENVLYYSITTKTSPENHNFP
eukprot:CAMPEP_0117807168 /NCGR_PEP_ID=MMETSP0948-20121206/19095_1 /TAXON_ID=44440 /ORGANISM="Chattonella subsalsa, Strain CCMP2191" /LENGTH=168 /DNA_ID=CAMNT_0005641967 /DNA_START=398 /DNA_END=901 /DNA_ORIENTATION=-